MIPKKRSKISIYAVFCTMLMSALLAAPLSSAYGANIIMTPNPTTVYIDYNGHTQTNLTLKYQVSGDMPFPVGANITTHPDKPWIVATVANPGPTYTVEWSGSQEVESRVDISAGANFSAGEVCIIYINGKVTDSTGGFADRNSTISVIGNPYCRLVANVSNWVDIVPNRIVDIPITVYNYGNCNTFVSTNVTAPSGFEYTVDSTDIRLDAPKFTVNESMPNRTIHLSLMAPKKFYTNEITTLKVKLDGRSAGINRMPQNETVRDTYEFTITLRNRGFYIPGYTFEGLFAALACAGYAYCAYKGKRKC
ncbi:MAG: hypothetical protein PHH26_04825 [Candidatus Thermoplasmatota archaeon]|nr:hypothetical protein [Candidatus Thermoplasmatota archaeon]